MVYAEVRHWKQITLSDSFIHSYDMDYEVNACRDSPQATDYHYGDLMGEDIAIPERVFLSWPTIQNQWADPITKMACWSYGIIHWTNIHNWSEGKQYDAKDYWKSFVKAHKREDYDPITRWSSLQAQLDFSKSKDWGLLSWYVKLDKKNKSEYQINLAKNRCVYTGSSNIDRKKTRDSEDKYAVIGKGAGHIFVIVWYWKKGLICQNSYWPKYMDNWYFYIHWEDIWALFSCYAMIDKKDYRTMDQWKAVFKKKSEEKIKDRFASIRGKYN